VERQRVKPATIGDQHGYGNACLRCISFASASEDGAVPETPKSHVQDCNRIHDQAVMTMEMLRCSMRACAG
jgi:hypothetical protein